MRKPLTVWITTNYGKFLEMRVPGHLTCFLRSLYAGQETTVRTGHRTADWFQIGKGVCQGHISSPCLFNFNAEHIMEKQTYCKWGKEYVKAVYCHSAYLTFMQSTSCEMPGWTKHKLESRLPGEIPNNLRYADDTTLMAESKEELKSLLMKVKEESKQLI